MAKGLQELFGRGTMVLSQDMIRREVLKERDGIDPPALPLIKQMLEYGSENCEVVILEGIFIADWYRAFYVEKDKDMYELTINQIKEYEAEARKQNLEWSL